MSILTARSTSTPLHPSLLMRPLIAALRVVELRRQRQHLARLDQSQLNDIGLSQEDVRTELERPIWDAPVHFTLK